MTAIGLIDCNNFYVSCERAFDAQLVGVPVIVASNNDGCAIARSNEAKALGVKMGDPIHLIRDRLDRHGVVVRSSNYTLYGDMQRRILAAVDEFASEVEIYSIDELFLDLTPFADRDLVGHANGMRDQIRRWTTIRPASATSVRRRRWPSSPTRPPRRTRSSMGSPTCVTRRSAASSSTASRWATSGASVAPPRRSWPVWESPPPGSSATCR
ncbi:hypothetical protein AB5I41_25015 [Sphingomonas sp. MMS24-JH45]